MPEFCKNSLCKNHDKAGESESGNQFRTCCDRVNQFLENGGFVVIGKNAHDPSSQLPFEAWAYKGRMDFQAAAAVTFGLGQNCCDALRALNVQLAKASESTNTAEHNDCKKPGKITSHVSHHCRRRWKCPGCGHVISWSYRQLADAGSPYCPKCETEMRMITEAKPSATETLLAPCQIDDFVQAAQNVVANWTTGHLAESVRELDRVLKELKAS